MKKKDPAQVMIDVCLSLQSKINAGDYDNMLTVVHEPWKGLHVAQRSTLLDMDSLDSADEPQVVQRKRLGDLQALVQHYHKHGPTGTFQASVCKGTLDDGSQTRLVYTFPKFCLAHAVDRKADMSSALLLGLASTEEHVRHALASPATGASLFVC